MMLFALGMSGCSKKVDEKSFGAVCEFYVEAFPEGFDQLPQAVRDDMYISISLKNTSSKKGYIAKLTKDNGFRHALNVIPGTYHVYILTSPSEKVVMFDVEMRVDSVTVEKDKRTEVPIYISNPSNFINSLKSNEPTAEILNSDIYSRKVQYNGKIIDLNNIREIMEFSNSYANERIKPTETFKIPSTAKNGISLVVQNQSRTNTNVSEAKFVGVSFSMNNVIFPQGITLGTSLYDIAHAQDGILGTPDYCLGSPFVGAEFESTTLVYIDKDSGDRISFYVNPGDSYVSSITYEFAKYE